MPLITERPIVTKISVEIVARLDALVAVPNDAFVFTGVVRPTKLGDYVPEHGLIVLTRGESVRVPELDCPGNPCAICYQQTFLIRVHIAPSEKDTTTPLEMYEDVAEAAIVKAIRVDSIWHTFDSNAINADFGPVQTATSDGGYDGIAVVLNVTYRISEDDPYTARG